MRRVRSWLLQCPAQCPVLQLLLPQGHARRKEWRRELGGRVRGLPARFFCWQHGGHRVRPLRPRQLCRSDRRVRLCRLPPGPLRELCGRHGAGKLQRVSRWHVWRSRWADQLGMHCLRARAGFCSDGGQRPRAVPCLRPRVYRSILWLDCVRAVQRWHVRLARFADLPSLPRGDAWRCRAGRLPCHCLRCVSRRQGCRVCGQHGMQRVQGGLLCGCCRRPAVHCVPAGHI